MVPLLLPLSIGLLWVIFVVQIYRKTVHGPRYVPVSQFGSTFHVHSFPSYKVGLKFLFRLQTSGPATVQGDSF